MSRGHGQLQRDLIGALESRDQPVDTFDVAAEVYRPEPNGEGGIILKDTLSWSAYGERSRSSLPNAEFSGSGAATISEHTGPTNELGARIPIGKGMLASHTRGRFSGVARSARLDGRCSILNGIFTMSSQNRAAGGMQIRKHQ